jgi:hypothetical protein
MKEACSGRVGEADYGARKAISKWQDACVLNLGATSCVRRERRRGGVPVRRCRCAGADAQVQMRRWRYGPGLLIQRSCAGAGTGKRGGGCGDVARRGEAWRWRLDPDHWAVSATAGLRTTAPTRRRSRSREPEPRGPGTRGPVDSLGSLAMCRATGGVGCLMRPGVDPRMAARNGAMM